MKITMSPIPLLLIAALFASNNQELHAQQSICGVAGGNPEVTTADRGTFIWKDCATDQWRLRITAANTLQYYKWMRFEGALSSSLGFDGITGVSLDPEYGDRVSGTASSKIASFQLNFSQFNQDSEGVDFNVPQGSSLCLSINTPLAPEPLPIFIGGSRTAATSGVNPDTLEPCVPGSDLGNLPPVFEPIANPQHPVGVDLSLMVSAMDKDGDAIVYSVDSAPPGVLFNPSTGDFTGVPTDTGTYPVTVTASDGRSSSTLSFDWTFVPVKDECGYAGGDPNVTVNDQGTFIWKDCATGRWSVRIAAARTGEFHPWMRFEGELASSGGFTSLVGVELDPDYGDAISESNGTESTFIFNFSPKNTDREGFDFTIADDSTLCFSVSTPLAPNPLPIYVGEARISVPDRFNPVSLEPCLPDTISALPEISLEDKTVSEADETVTLTANLSRASVSTVTVNLTTADAMQGEATMGIDYQIASSELSFPPGTTTASIAINIFNDTEIESTEKFDVRLQDPSGAILSKSTGMVTILDDDARNIAPELGTVNDQSNAIGDSVLLQVTANDADGDTLTFSSASALPPGVILDKSTGQISGSPISDGEYAVTLEVSDGVESDSKAFNWVIKSGTNACPINNTDLRALTKSPLLQPAPAGVQGLVFNCPTRLSGTSTGIRPEDFGAVGNGSTDDTKAMVAASTTASSKNKLLVLTQGKTYLVSASIPFRRGARGIVVDGNSATLKAKRSMTRPLVLLQAIGWPGNVSDFVIQDVVFDMNNSSSRFAVFGQNPSRLGIYDNKFVNLSSSASGVRLRAYHLHGDIEDVCIERNEVTGDTELTHTGDGIFVDGADAQPVIRPDEYWQANYDIQPMTAKVVRTKIKDNKVVGGYYGIALTNASYSLIANNQIRGNRRNIKVQRNSHHNVIDSNVLEDSISTSILIAYRARQNLIMNNKITTSRATSWGMIEVTVGTDGNIIYNNDLNSPTAKPSHHYGVYIGIHANTNEVLNNRINGYFSKGYIAAESSWAPHPDRSHRNNGKKWQSRPSTGQRIVANTINGSSPSTPIVFLGQASVRLLDTDIICNTVPKPINPILLRKLETSPAGINGGDQNTPFY